MSKKVDRRGEPRSVSQQGILNALRIFWVTTMRADVRRFFVEPLIDMYWHSLYFRQRLPLRHMSFIYLWLINWPNIKDESC